MAWTSTNECSSWMAYNGCVWRSKIVFYFKYFKIIHNFSPFSLLEVMLGWTSVLTFMKPKFIQSCQISGQWLLHCHCHNLKEVSVTIITSKLIQGCFQKTKLTFRIVIIGGYSWTHQKCVNTIQAYDPSKDAWERPGNLPIELSGVKAAVLSIPYSLSSGSKKPSAVCRPI